jgi:anaerobic dimethyl sulfoxide reductase subunit C (anchor subunit)
MKDLPLILFTLCMQAAIGAVLWAALIRLKDKEAPAFKTNTLVALILSAVGILASLVHLGKPLLAMTSLFNLFSSWLSREILFSGGFFVLLAISWWLEKSEKAESARNTLAWLASLVGLVAVFAMGQLYMQTVIPAWQSANTLVDFYATTLILGAVVLFVTAGKEREKLPRLDLAVLAIVFVQIAFVPGYLTGMAAMAGAGQESAALLAGSYGLMTILRWLFMLGGIFLFVLSRTDKFAKQAGILYTAVGILLIGAFIGRFLFYISGIPIGIGII